ncbi:hypothetical protein CHLNCDRAFT_145454 [Chlorella variabilis]|uniref:HotDog ACOT-type domain-containing protein n=1 Tax=Chlorella variabilis TaxID=554065 RepID=E1ZEG5_CHLVA|nr:hypothetical protein CHLNCDRAFT_145454 [Chlorella variabilis]EFN56026.1 hypothetical protein CHLNCDRAFT_145454 [Chlorella variabilis]|eukprot:XP_005848128.1 hypothetical protein CHLNCDRAFT_145454 [Chlorella variabilis]
MALAGVCRGTARGLLSAAAEPALAVGCLQLVRGLATGTGAAAAAAAGEGEQPTHVFDDGGDIVGTYTPVTKRLWQQRYKWTDDKLAAAAPRDPAAQLVKPPKLTTVVYPFSSDEVLREHYKNPWNTVRIARVLEDLDSLAGFVAYEHCDDGDPATRPPLLVTATVEAIQLSSSQLSLQHDMAMRGRVAWTGTSSMDIRMELEQGGKQQLTALFTFVARDALSGKPFAINSLEPQSQQDRELFEQRLRINQERKAARKRSAGSGSGGKLQHVSAEAERWAEQLLAAAKTKRDLPALADANLLLMDDTSLENTFTCQPQQRNMHGRIFGGFLMRRAFELAHSTAYLFAGCRPRTGKRGRPPSPVDQITFQRAVNVGDLIKFKSRVTRAWALPDQPGQGVVHLQVEASVTQPERLSSEVTNTMNFLFQVDLRCDAAGHFIPPKQVLPSTEQQALEVAALFGPGGRKQSIAPAAGSRGRGAP